MRIDCDLCAMRATATCDDCIVTFLLDRPDGAVVLDIDEARAIRTLQEGGLVASTRFVPLLDATAEQPLLGHRPRPPDCVSQRSRR